MKVRDIIRLAHRYAARRLDELSDDAEPRCVVADQKLSPEDLERFRQELRDIAAKLLKKGTLRRLGEGTFCRSEEKP